MAGPDPNGRVIVKHGEHPLHFQPLTKCDVVAYCAPETSPATPAWTIRLPPAKPFIGDVTSASTTAAVANAAPGSTISSSTSSPVSNSNTAPNFTGTIASAERMINVAKPPPPPPPPNVPPKGPLQAFLEMQQGR